jgi:hypothetical protein
MIKRDGIGRFYVLRPSSPSGLGDVPVVFDSTGRFVSRLGRLGDGRGEYQGARVVAIGPADTAFIFDLRTQRLSVSAPNLRFVRSTAVQVLVLDATMASKDRIAIAAIVPDPDRFGIPLHLLDPTGRYVLSFGEDIGRPILPDEEAPLRRKLASAAMGGIWSADEWGQYRIRRWDANGHLVTEFTRRAAWLSEGIPSSSKAPDIPPPASIAGLFEDDDGLLWVLVTVTDRRNWARALRSFQPSPEEIRTRTVPGPFYLIVDYELAFDTVIEVIDPVNRVLLASLHTDSLFNYAVGPGRVARLIRKESGAVIPEVWKVRLHRPSR